MADAGTGGAGAHELDAPHEYGDANIFIENGDALAIARMRYFAWKNHISLGLAQRGLSEFLLSGKALSVSRSGFKRFELFINEVSKDFPKTEQFRALSGWELRFGRNWEGLTPLDDAIVKKDWIAGTPPGVELRGRRDLRGRNGKAQAEPLPASFDRLRDGSAQAEQVRAWVKVFPTESRHASKSAVVIEFSGPCPEWLDGPGMDAYVVLTAAVPVRVEGAQG